MAIDYAQLRSLTISALIRDGFAFESPNRFRRLKLLK
jgi:hypothetical protein